MPPVWSKPSQGPAPGSSFLERMAALRNECDPVVRINDEAVAQEAKEEETKGEAQGGQQALNAVQEGEDSDGETVILPVDDLQKRLTEEEMSKLEEHMCQLKDRPDLKDLIERLMNGYKSHWTVGAQREDQLDELDMDPCESMADNIAAVIDAGGGTSHAEAIRYQGPLYELRPFEHKKYGSMYTVRVPGGVSEFFGERAKFVASEEEIERVMSCEFMCCSNNCLERWIENFGTTMARAIITVWRHAYAGMDYIQRMIFHEDKIRESREYVLKDPVAGGDRVATGVQVRMYSVETKQVMLCQDAYCAITGLSARSCQRYVRNVKDDGNKAVRGRPIGSDAASTLGARAWFSQYAAMHDRMPNKSRYGHTEIHLDVRQKKVVWEMYKDFMRAKGFMGCEISSKKSFLKLWNKEFPHVRPRRYKPILSKCYVCEDLENLVRVETSRTKLRALRILQLEHRLFQQKERNQYYNRRNAAMAEPHKYTSMIADGMTQSVCNIPRKAFYDYSGQTLSQKLEGVLVHGADTQLLHIHRIFPWYETSANVTISCIWKTIKLLIESKRIPMGKVLFLQLDGAADNINQTMLRFCSWLCQEEIFKTVTISRLPVGHTHEDVDQKFSVISRKLRNSDMITPEEFEWAVKGAFLDVERDADYKVQCVVETLWACWDFVRWLEGQAVGVFPFELKHWCRREDTLHQQRLSRDEGNVYIAVRKYAQRFVREVRTRHMKGSTSYKTDRLRDFPVVRKIICGWAPNDSVHQGKLYCADKIVGEPQLLEFGKVYDKEGNVLDQAPQWVVDLDKLKDCLESDHFSRGSVFFPERVNSWRRWFEDDVPRAGLASLPASRIPEFALDKQLATSALPAPVVGESAARELLKSTGFDEEGRRRVDYKDGKDVAVYARAQLMADFAEPGQQYGRLLDGTMYLNRLRQKAKGLYRGQKVAVSFHGLIRAAGNLRGVVARSLEEGEAEPVVVVPEEEKKKDEAKPAESAKSAKPKKSKKQSLATKMVGPSKQKKKMEHSRWDKAKMVVTKRVQGPNKDLRASELFKQCEGWWLATVEGYWLTTGEYVEAPKWPQDNRDDPSGSEDEPSGIKVRETWVADKVEEDESDGAESGSTGMSCSSTASGSSSDTKPKHKGARSKAKLKVNVASSRGGKKGKKREKASSSSASSEKPDQKRVKVRRGGGGGKVMAAEGKGKEAAATNKGPAKPPGPGPRQVARRRKGKRKKKELIGPPIVSVKLAWYGGRNKTGVACLPDAPMMPLQYSCGEGEQPECVTDKIPREFIFWEESREGEVKLTQQEGCMYANSVRKIQQWAPNAEVNQAGEYVGIGYDMPGDGEQERWIATLEEVAGFSWKWDDGGLDQEAPEFKVYGLRRWNHKTYVIMVGDDSEMQQDHKIGAVRDSIYFAKVASKYKMELPYYLLWPQLRKSQFALDWDMLEANARSYMDTMRSGPTPDEDQDLMPPYPPGTNWMVLKPKHLCAMFEGRYESTYPNRTGEFVQETPIEVGLEWLIDHLIKTAPYNRPRVLVGSSDTLRRDNYQEKYSDKPARQRGPPGETEKMGSLRRLLRRGIKEEVVCDTAEDYIDYIRTNFDRVLLPYNLGGYHFIVFEIAYGRGEDGPYFKVWDSLDSWGEVPDVQEAMRIPEIDLLVRLFFHPSEGIDLFYRREDGDPDQGSGHGCAVYMFMTTMYLALGLQPPAMTQEDDAFARNFLWDCCIQGRLPPLPKLKFVE